MGACQICCDLQHTLLHPRTAAQGPRQRQPQQPRQRARRSLPNPPQQRAQQRLDDLLQRLQQQQQIIQQLQQQQRQRQQRQRQQLQQQAQRQPQRRQQQLPRRQQLQPQAIAVPQPAAAPASTQGLVNQIVSALSQLTGSTIAPVQGGRHVEARSGRVEDDFTDFLTILSTSTTALPTLTEGLQTLPKGNILGSVTSKPGLAPKKIG
ncbi:RNA polymerase II degradation factor 1-like [Lucilia sericata]|uniref:RNA polymerase II degradation factor 1-like n=1 Tax=Lucilia sericata TaxID=13632 RepID=UPI0018A86291|nr:RNA polymerase II degradation factor 1-like [Lucilia sericata]